MKKVHNNWYQGKPGKSKDEKSNKEAFNDNYDNVFKKSD